MIDSSHSAPFIPPMRDQMLSVLLGGLIVAGCSSTPTNQPAPSAEANAAPADVNMPGGKPVVRPVNLLNGRVLAVNNQLRFVIVDFPAQRMPRLDQNLAVYRQDLKVAEIRISGPYRGTTVAADITAGEIREGDQVREER